MKPDSHPTVSRQAANTCFASWLGSYWSHGSMKELRALGPLQTIRTISMNKGVVYIRVSDDDQVNGMSPDFQRADCLALAKKQEVDAVEVFQDDGESAKFMDRPQLLALLEYCRKHQPTIKTLIVWKLDRLSRIQEDYYY